MSRLALALLLALSGCAGLRPANFDPQIVSPWDCGDPSSVEGTNAAGLPIGAGGQSPGSSTTGTSTTGSSTTGQSSGTSVTGGPSTP